jgi:hypothetical protein
MVVWDLKALKPKQVLAVPGGPLEIRWSLAKGDDWAITAAALTSKLWLVQARKGRAVDREGRSPPSAIPPRSRCRSTSASAPTARGLWVNTFMDGKTRYFDLTNPEAPQADLREGHRQAGEHDLAELGRQARLHHLVAARELGQGRGRTTSSSCAPSPGTEKSSSPPSRSISRRRSWDARTT